MSFNFHLFSDCNLAECGKVQELKHKLQKGARLKMSASPETLT